MPLGVICNTLSIAVGGLLGGIFGRRLSPDFKQKLNLVFSICALGIGITSTVLLVHLPAVILSLILGTILGSVLRLGFRIEKAGIRLASLFPSRGGGEEDSSLLVTAIVLFCASSTGIFGSIVSGITGDHTILLAKSILDFFTAMIFACSLGLVVSAIAIPQLIIFLILFFASRLIYPLTTPDMMNDFKAVGGLILLATGLRIARIRDYPVADMIPAMILIFPISWLWSTYIA